MTQQVTHGTPQGYLWHHTQHVPYCDLCLTASTVAAERHRAARLALWQSADRCLGHPSRAEV